MDTLLSLDDALIALEGRTVALDFDRAVPFTGSWDASVRAASLLVDGAKLDSTAQTDA